MNLRVLLAIVVAAALAAGLAARLRSSAGWRSPPAPVAEAAQTSPSAAAAQSVQTSTTTIASAARQGLTASATQFAFAASDVDQLANSFAEAVDAYRSETPDAFCAWLGKQGIKPPKTFADPTSRQAVSQWKLRTRLITNCTFDLSKPLTVVRTRSAGNVLAATGFPATAQSISQRQNPIDAGFVDPEALHLDELEIDLPATFGRPKGEPYPGVFGLRFVRRPSDGKWVVTAAVHRGNPSGQPFYPPPPF
jgi:hypothetical protein